MTCPDRPAPPLLYCAEDTESGYSWPWCWEQGVAPRRRLVWARCADRVVETTGEEMKGAA